MMLVNCLASVVDECYHHENYDDVGVATVNMVIGSSDDDGVFTDDCYGLNGVK